MAVSIFSPLVVDGWRDPDPPLATPGVVWMHSKPDVNTLTVQASGDMSEGSRRRIAPYYAGVDEDLYVTRLVFSSQANRIILQTSNGAGQLRNLSRDRLSDLGLVFRSIGRTLAVRLNTSDVTSPYTWAFSGTAVEDFRRAVNGNTVQVALVDHTVGNVLFDSVEVVNARPVHVPFVPVAEPVSMFHEAAVPGDTDVLDATPGLVWRSVRRGRLPAVGGYAKVVDTTQAGLEPASQRIPPLYAGGSPDAYVVRLDFRLGEVRLDVQTSPSDRNVTHQARNLELGNLALVVRGGTGVSDVYELNRELEDDSEEPYIWMITGVGDALFRSLQEGNAIALLVDRNNRNVDLANVQFRSLGALDETPRVEVYSEDPLRMRANMLYTPPDEAVGISVFDELDIDSRAGVSFTPFTGESPIAFPLSFEVKERPTSGRYRSRRWVDHTGDITPMSFTRNLGSIGQAQINLTSRRNPGVSYEPSAPDYFGRAVYQRLLATNNLGFTFSRLTAGALLDPGDEIVLDGITISPAHDLTRVNWEVLDRYRRGGQRYSLFDRGSAGPDELSGIRARQRVTLGSGGRLPLSLAVGGVSFTSMVLSQVGFIISFEGIAEDVASFQVQHSVFVRHESSGDTWALDLLGAELQGEFLVVTIPEPDRGRLSQLASDRSAEDYTVVIVQSHIGFGFDRAPNTRLDSGQREIVLRSGDSLFDAAVPASSDDDDYAGLIARVESADPGGAAGGRTLSDATQRFIIERGRSVSSIGLTAANQIDVNVQDLLGNPASLSSGTLSRYTLIVRVGDSDFAFPLAGSGFSSGRYRLSGSAAPLRAALTGSGTITFIVVERSHYALDSNGTALGSDDGDFAEIEVAIPLVPRSTDARYVATFQANPPRAAYGQTRETVPWVPPDGAEFRVVQHLWSSNPAEVTMTSPGSFRMTRHAGRFPPLVDVDRILLLTGVDLLDGSDPRTTPIQITRLDSNYIYFEAEAELTGDPVRWYRAIDRLPAFGGWLKDPSASNGPGRLQDVGMSAQDYSVVLDNRHHGGGEIVSTDGETSGSLVRRLVKQWEEGINGADPEGIGLDRIDVEVGESLTPPYNTTEAGGDRTSWRGHLESIQSRAGSHIGYYMDAEKRLVWSAHGTFTGLVLDGNDYQIVTETQDSQRSRNVVDVRQAPDSTISILIEDREDIVARQRVGGGSGRKEVIDDSTEGNDPGLARAEAYALDSLDRYPFLVRNVFGGVDVLRNPDGQSGLLTYRQLISLINLQPGDSFFAGGAHLPPMPQVRATVIADGVVYIEPFRDDEAIPAQVTVGKLIRIPEVRQTASDAGWAYFTDPWLYGSEQWTYGEPRAAVDQPEAIMDVLGTGGPRGSFWCRLREDQAVDAGVPLTAHLVERWLAVSITIEPSLGAAGLKDWQVEGIRPRVLREPGQVALAQDGDAGRWRRILSGALG